MPKQVKRMVQSWLYWHKDTASVRLLLSLKSPLAVNKKNVRQQALGTTKLQPGRGQKGISTERDDCKLIQMSLKNHDIKWPSNTVENWAWDEAHGKNSLNWVPTGRAEVMQSQKKSPSSVRNKEGPGWGLLKTIGIGL